jgi:gamma-glutamylcysteine synthetase
MKEKSGLDENEDIPDHFTPDIFKQEKRRHGNIKKSLYGKLLANYVRTSWIT